MMYQEVFPAYGNNYNKCRHRPEPPDDAFFIRGTTPSFEFTFTDDFGNPLELSDLLALEAYVSQDAEDGEPIVVTKTAADMDLDGGTLRFVLSQAETLRFIAGEDPFPKYAYVQVRGLYDDGMVWATLEEKAVKVCRLSKDGEIVAQS